MSEIRDGGPRGRPSEPGAVRGERRYLDLLERVHRELRPAFYLEIGVRLGRSLSLATCQAVGVDPDFDIQFPLGSNTSLFQETSDEFFTHHAREVVPSSPSLVFIDGMHLFEFALRDFINAEELVSPPSLIVIDDVFPNNPLQATRERQTRVWTGDVWKITVALQELRPDLILVLLDTEPTGLLLVAGLDHTASTLKDNYESTILELSRSKYSVPPQSVLDREGALHPDDASVWELLRRLRVLGQDNANVSQVQKSLADVNLR